jgi:hypothetical protein
MLMVRRLLAGSYLGHEGETRLTARIEEIAWELLVALNRLHNPKAVRFESLSRATQRWRESSASTILTRVQILLQARCRDALGLSRTQASIRYPIW